MRQCLVCEAVKVLPMEPHGFCPVCGGITVAIESDFEDNSDYYYDNDPFGAECEECGNIPADQYVEPDGTEITLCRVCVKQHIQASSR